MLSTFVVSNYLDFDTLLGLQFYQEGDLRFFTGFRALLRQILK